MRLVIDLLKAEQLGFDFAAPRKLEAPPPAPPKTSWAADITIEQAYDVWQDLPWDLKHYFDDPWDIKDWGPAFKTKDEMIEAMRLVLKVGESGARMKEALNDLNKPTEAERAKLQAWLDETPVGKRGSSYQSSATSSSASGTISGGALKPPGKGWQRIPNGKRGGYRRRSGAKWVYWYPLTKALINALTKAFRDAGDDALVKAQQLGFDFRAPAKPEPKPVVKPQTAGPKPVIAPQASPKAVGPKPPGTGWQIIPGGKKGGFRRRKGRGWEYWYPDGQAPAKPKAEVEAQSVTSIDIGKIHNKTGRRTIRADGKTKGYIERVLTPDGYGISHYEIHFFGKTNPLEGKKFNLLSEASKAAVEGLRQLGIKKAPAGADVYTGGLLTTDMDIDAAGDAIRHASQEHIGVFTGGQMIWRNKGRKGSVEVSRAICEKMVAAGDAQIVHNHPSGTCFSPDDLMLTICNNAAEMRATRPNGEVWVLKRSGSDWGSRWAGMFGVATLQKEITAIRRGVIRDARQKTDIWVAQRGWSVGKELPDGTQEQFNEYINEISVERYNRFLSGLGVVTKIGGSAETVPDDTGSGLAADVPAPRPSPEVIRAADPKTLTPQFKAWFGDWTQGQGSKVVKADGTPAEQVNIDQPRVVYHGTAVGGFRNFDPARDKGYNLFGKGFYFTEDQGIAEEYTTKDEGKAIAETSGLRMKDTNEAITTLKGAAVRKHLLGGDNPNWDFNMAWAVKQATGKRGSVDVQKLIAEFWNPSGTKEEHKAFLQETFGGPYANELRDKPTEHAGIQFASRLVRAAGGKTVRSADMGMGAKVAPDSAVDVVLPESQVFEVYLNIRKPIDLDTAIPNEALKGLQRALIGGDASRTTKEVERARSLIPEREANMNHAAALEDEVKRLKLMPGRDHLILGVLAEKGQMDMDAVYEGVKAQTNYLPFREFDSEAIAELRANKLISVTGKSWQRSVKLTAKGRSVLAKETAKRKELKAWTDKFPAPESFHVYVSDAYGPMEAKRDREYATEQWRQTRQTVDRGENELERLKQGEVSVWAEDVLMDYGDNPSPMPASVHADNDQRNGNMKFTREAMLTAKRHAVETRHKDRHKMLHVTDKDTLTWGDVYYFMTEGLAQKGEKDVFRKWAESQGYDGLAHTGGWNVGTEAHRVWIAWEPTQIKATESEGFDPKDVDIYKASRWLDDLLVAEHVPLVVIP